MTALIQAVLMLKFHFSKIVRSWNPVVRHDMSLQHFYLKIIPFATMWMWTMCYSFNKHVLDSFDFPAP